MGFRSGLRGPVGGLVQGGCERRIEVFVKNAKKESRGCLVRSAGGCWSGGGGREGVLIGAVVGSQVGGRGRCGVWGM